MLECTRCLSSRIANFSGKHDDRCVFTYRDIVVDDSIPALFEGFEGDYFRLNVCLDCGTIQNWKPVSDEEIRSDLE